jgi:predicted metal-binding membrane protein
MAGMTGTMGLGLAAFVPVWTLMMAAMMLPSAIPLATRYAGTLRGNRTVRTAGLVAGYLAVRRSRDLRAGVHHGAYCLGCCGVLMVLLVAVGVMNLTAMVGLAAVVLVEKTWRWGPVAGRVFGVAALGLAVAIIWLPWLAPGLHAASPMTMG